MLRNASYLQFRQEWGEKLRRDEAATAPQNGTAKPPRDAAAEEARERAERRASALAFVLASLADSELPAAEKLRRRRAFVAGHGEEGLPPEAPSN
jgi:hypothetical protein